MKKTLLATTAIALALLAGAVLLTGRAVTAAPDCPTSWPEQDHQGFFTDDAGKEWFIIRSADSNGYHTVRAYPASGRYPNRYVINSPDQVCYLLVRRAGESADDAEPAQLEFRKEQEPTPAPTRPLTPLTLLDLLNRLSPADRQAAILCLLQIAGNRTLEELNNDPEFLQMAIARGCLSP